MNYFMSRLRQILEKTTKEQVMKNNLFDKKKKINYSAY